MKKAPLELLAILGRGIRKIREGGSWEATEDLEICDENGAHLPVRAPADDADPHCLIGGGDMNICAGAALARLHAATLAAVVCAYAPRPPYLVSAHGPNESEVMSERFRVIAGIEPHIRIPVWERTRAASGRANTNGEMHNIFEYAAEHKLAHIGIVTVEVHFARALLMARELLLHPRFKHLRFQMYASESVLQNEQPSLWEARIRAMHESKAYLRTFAREEHGINCFLSGKY